MKLANIFKLVVAALFLVSKGKSQCYVALSCNNQPTWLETTSFCSGSTNQSSVSATVKDLESQIQDLWTQFRQLNESFYKPKTATGCKNLFTFTEDSHKDYVRFNGTIPVLDSFTICAWVSPLPDKAQVLGSLFSYCVGKTSGCNSLVWVFRATKIDMLIESTNLNLGKLPVETRTHVCVVKSMTDSKVYIYYNGTEQTRKNYNKRLSAGGVFIIGQDQDGSLKGDNIGPINEAPDGYTGYIEDFYLWNRAFTPEEITAAYESPCSCSTEATISFSSTNSIISGDVIGNYSLSC